MSWSDWDFLWGLGIVNYIFTGWVCSPSLWSAHACSVLNWSLQLSAHLSALNVFSFLESLALSYISTTHCSRFYYWVSSIRLNTIRDYRINDMTGSLLLTILMTIIIQVYINHLIPRYLMSELRAVECLGIKR